MTPDRPDETLAPLLTMHETAYAVAKAPAMPGTALNIIHALREECDAQRAERWQLEKTFNEVCRTAFANLHDKQKAEVELQEERRLSAKKDATIAALTAAWADRASKLADTQHGLETHARITDRMLAEKDATLTGLRIERDQAEHEYQELRAELAEKDATIEHWKLEYARTADTAIRLNDALAEKDAKLAEMNATVRQAQREHDLAREAFEIRLSQADQDYRTQNRAIADQHDKLAEQSATLARLEQELDGIKSAVTYALPEMEDGERCCIDPATVNALKALIEGVS
jgi:chromosome segregation ATPase